MNLDLLAAELERDEGIRYVPYQDQFGSWTVGVGHLMANPISHAAVMQILNDDIAAAILAVNGRIPWFPDLDEVRQRVLTNLCFQLGIEGLMQFTVFLGYMAEGNYDAAADDLAQTKLARETPERCQREIVAIRTGAMP